LHRDRDHRAVELVIGKRHPRLAIEVVHNNLAERRIIFHLRPIHPKPDHTRRPQMRRQMRPPTAHQIEDRAALREQLRVDLADLRNRTVVDVSDEPRDRVKYLIIIVIDASKEIRGKLPGHGGNPVLRACGQIEFTLRNQPLSEIS